jgi:hypothetical protein
MIEIFNDRENAAFFREKLNNNFTNIDSSIDFTNGEVIELNNKFNQQSQTIETLTQNIQGIIGGGVSNIVTLTQAEYMALTPIPTTLYIIVE